MLLAKPRTIAVLEPPTRTARQVARHSAAALESLGLRVSSLPYYEGRIAHRLPLPGVDSLERAWGRRRILAWIESVEPDLLFVCKGVHVSAETIQWVRGRTGLPWACWFIDDPISLPTSTALSPHYDYFFTTDQTSAQAHRDAGSPNVEVLPYACHPTLHRPVSLAPEEETSLKSDVAFVGTINAVHRRDVLEALTDFDLKVWGGTTGVHRSSSGSLTKGELRLSDALHRRLAGRWAWDEEVTRIYAAAAVVLNVQHPDLLNMRLFEAPACGAFLLTDGRDYVGEFFEPELEVALYDGPHDVADRVAYWISRPEERAAIAEAGRLRAHRDHTYVNRMRTLLDTCFGPEPGGGQT